MELWLRPPTTAISVLKFCSCSSFWGTQRREAGVTNRTQNWAQRFWSGGRGIMEKKDSARLAFGEVERGQERDRHLCHMDEVRDDQGPLWGCGLAENHELHPLRDTIEKGDESLQDGVVHSAAVGHETVVVLELGGGRGAASVPCGPLPLAMTSPCPPHALWWLHRKQPPTSL